MSNFKRDIYCAETHKLVATVTDSMVFDNLTDADIIFNDGEKWLADNVNALLQDIQYFTKYVLLERLVDQIKADIAEGDETALYELLSFIPKENIEAYLNLD